MSRFHETFAVLLLIFQDIPKYIRQNISENGIWQNSAKHVLADQLLAISHVIYKNIIGALNFGDFMQKLPIAKIYSSIFCLVQYLFVVLKCSSNPH